MNRSVCRVISNEDIYRNITINCLSNKANKLISLKYESVVIDEKLAEGGYGTVYKVHSFTKQYALKKLCVNNEDKLLRCIQEIFILKNIHNEYILQFIDSIIYQTDLDIFEVYILTDLYSGYLSTDIKTLSASNKYYDESEVLLIMTSISEAVACLHNFHLNPIIHRDLKVENILIGYPTRYVLCDFGSATLKEVRPCEVNRQELQDEISQFTTLPYRSPEMADLYFDSGEHIIGRKSDIWAMGVMMYNISFLSLPFGENVLSILSGQFTVPDKHPYSDNLLKTINYCLTIIPEERPDIYQLSSLLCSMSSRVNPVRNSQKSTVPQFETLTLPTTESDARSINSTRQSKNMNNKKAFGQPISTSIKPRTRPKAGGKSNNLENNNFFTIESSQEKEISKSDSCESNQTNSTEKIDNPTLERFRTDDLMDFNSPMIQKMNQLCNTPKSQSLGQRFDTVGSGQRFNVYQMISNSYQNVFQLQNNFPPQYNNPFAMKNPANMSKNSSQMYPQNYRHDTQIGYRHMVSDPSSWFQSPPNSIHSNNSATKVLQPMKMSTKGSATNILDEFDPLTN